MAKTNVPNQPDNNGDSKKREQAARSRKQKGYQESLSYERAFLKKKTELNTSAEIQKRQKEIEERRKAADEEMRIARLTIRSKEDLQKKLSSIQAKFVTDTAAMQRELVSEREKNEYAAHLFASECARKAAQAQNLRQRAQTAAALADAQKVQTERLRNTKELEIADLQAQKKSATTAEARKEIDTQIRKLRREITAAEKEEIRSQEAAADLAKRVADADFARLSAKDKLKQKQRELTALQAEADSAINDIESHIAAKKLDLEVAKESGKSEKTTDKLEKEIADLQSVLDSTTERYNASIHELTNQIERSGGFRDQAKQESGTKVTPVVPPAPPSEVYLVAPAPGVSFPVVPASKAGTPAENTDKDKSEIPESVSSTDVAAQIGLVLNGLQTFETAFANYVDAVESMVTPETTEERVDGVVPLDTTSVENALKDSSSTLINQLRTLVDQSVNEDIELRSQLNAKIDELNEGLNGQLSSLSNLPSSSSESYATSVPDLVSEITEAVKSHVESQESTDESVLTPPPVVDTTVPDKLTLDDTSVVSQLVLIQQTLSTFVNTFDSYLNTVDARFNSSDTALQSMRGMLTPTVSTPVSDSSYEQSEALRAMLLSNTSFSDSEKSALVAELDRIERRLDSGMDVDLTSVSDAVTQLGSEISYDDLADDLSALQKSLLEEILDGRFSLTDNSEDPRGLLPAIVGGRILQEQQDKLSGRLDRRITNLAQIEKTKKFFGKGDDSSKYRKEAALEKLFEKLQGALDSLADLSKDIDNNINDYFQYQAEINAKLQGTDKDYESILDTLTKNLGMSMLVKQQDYITEFKKLVDVGIAHNMETRAFLATVSEKVVNTFDAFDSNLLRLVRLQQQDTTAARLGLESSLNKLFNTYFKDSSYLSDSGPHDSISAAILEASSMLSNDMSVEFEYMVHKWLGSLYSLGMSSDTLESIAQGLNYLGTGNVAALNSNESLQTLLAMSAARGGEAYAEILIDGLDADTTNNLLRGMITYLMEIANNTDNNQVTKSAYSDLFGMHMSDLRSIVNMTETDITSLANLTTTYSQAVNETQNQLGQIINRTHISQMVDTLFENAVLGASLDIGKNPVSYGLWKTLNIVEGLTGGIALPFVNVFGSGFDLNTTVTQLAKGAMAGLSMIGNLIGALSSGGLNTGMDINAWNNDAEIITRGTAASFLSSGTASGFSSSGRIDYAGSQNAEDMKKTELADAADDADKDAEIVNKNAQEEQELPQKIYEQIQLISQAVAEDDNTVLKQSVQTYRLLESIEDTLGSGFIGAMNDVKTLLDPSRVFITSALSDIGITQEYLRIGNPQASVTANNTYNSQLSTIDTISSITSTLLDIVESADLYSSNIDIWSLISSTDNLSATTLNKKLSAYYATDNSGFHKFDAESKNSDANSTLISEIASEFSSTNVTQLNALKQLAEIQTLNKVIFPDYVRATVDELSPAVKKFIEELLKKAVEYTVNGTDMDVEEGFGSKEEYHPIVRQLRSILTDTTNPVRVTTF